jgi:hypothetical protein
MRALGMALLTAAVAGLAGWALGRMGRRWAVVWWIGAALALGLAAAAVWMVLTARTAPGMEGLAWFLVALILLGPAVLGLSLGLWLGGRR